LTTGQLFLHSWRHFFGLQRSELTIAIRVSRSVISLYLFSLFLSPLVIKSNKAKGKFGQFEE
jgi:predicted transcriptional regulator